MSDSTPAIRRAILQGQRNVQAFERVTEQRLKEIYRSASRKINARIRKQAGNVKYLQRLQRDLHVELWRLNRKVQAEVERHLAASTRQGIRTIQGAGRIGISGTRFTASRLTAAQFGQINARVIRALQTSVSGITLSERVWNIHERTLRDMRRMIADGILSGTPMSQMHRDIKRFLIVRDADMRTKKWREFYRLHPPGRGVYRSAYKNAERVIRTEGMRAIRLGTIEYAKTRTWVRGIKWNLSSAHPKLDLCDDFASQDLYGLGPGVYPPDATPDAAHPQCLCYLSLIPVEQVTKVPTIRER